jgi:hypothetical protein
MALPAAWASCNGQMPCFAGAQVVGDKHDVEEGAPVLKKTVFGVCLCALSVQAVTWRQHSLGCPNLCFYLNQLCF